MVKNKRFAARLVASLAIIGLALGASGCSIKRDVESLKPYTPSDGAQVDLAQLKARNFIYLKNRGGAGALIGSLVNSGNEATRATLQFTDAATGQKAEISYQVGAGQKLDLGYNGQNAAAIDLEGEPGQLVKIYVVETGVNGKAMLVPVLDGTLAEYRPILEGLGG